MKPEEDLILLGRITKPQGHRGAVRMLPEFEPLDRFEGLKTNELLLRPTLRSPQGTAERRVHVEGYFLHGRFVVLELEEIPDMNAAELIREMEVYVSRADLWDLEPGQFLTHELEGFTVLDGAINIGSVKAIHPGSAHDFLVVRTPAKKEFLVPLVKEIVKEINPEAKTIQAILPEGITEL